MTGQLLVFAGSLAGVGLWLWFADQPPRIWDECDYDALARNLVEHGVFGYQPDTPASLRPPLHPALVAVVYALAGVGNYQAVRLVQLGLGLVTAVVAYGLGRALYDRRVGLWLAGLVALYPSLAGTNCLLLTETLFTLFVVPAFYLMLAADHSKLRLQQEAREAMEGLPAEASSAKGSPSPR